MKKDLFNNNKELTLQERRESLPTFIRDWLVDNNRTPSFLAKQLNVTRQAVFYWIKGVNAISNRNLEKMMIFFNKDGSIDI